MCKSYIINMNVLIIVKCISKNGSNAKRNIIRKNIKDARIYSENLYIILHPEDQSCNIL